MDTLEKQKVVVIQSDCVCVEEDGTPYEECFGCWDDSLERLAELKSEWAQRIGGKSFDQVIVEAKAMGFFKESGRGVIDFDTLHKATTLRGDFRIVFTLEDNNLTALRYSHDEPTGGGRFTFLPFYEDED